MFKRISSRGVDRRCGLVADRFFVASPAMQAFRKVAAAEMRLQRIWTLMSQPGMREWFRDWATPQQCYNTRLFLPLEAEQLPQPVKETVVEAAPRHVDESEEWSAPRSPSEWAKIFDVHYNTIIQWLKSQTIRNRKVSPRRYCVAKFELPD
jgi:hypothetical protein